MYICPYAYMNITMPYATFLQQKKPILRDLGGEKRKEKGDRDLQNSPAVSVPRELASFPILSYYRVEGIHVEFSVLES